MESREIGYTGITVEEVKKYFEKNKDKPFYYEWKPFANEEEVEDYLAGRFNMTQQIDVEYGRVDLVGEKSFIEVKKLKGWKSALGQALYYREELPNHIAEVALFSHKESISRDKVEDIAKFYSKYGVGLYLLVKPQIVYLVGGRSIKMSY